MFCTKCGKEIMDEAVICVGCGCPVDHQSVQVAEVFGDENTMINTLAQRLNTNGIIWLVIGILQIVGGFMINWFLLIVGVLNIISSVQDMQYSKKCQKIQLGSLRSLNQ